ncbi:hypothetical protein ES288_D07G133000v1 [Gossypium darwinii]|uniref:Uncharacterized protein n=2 Tax=Gossypium TaxID=3633 RepID=A0A5D2K621_GOSTO|nr:hypothetical protein ES288_D07G133000v1 [Gossypium darwinii]TYH62601.1 hypothetical protein ES332_D07G131400v1 [Gossypium tomentosum]
MILGNLKVRAQFINVYGEASNVPTATAGWIDETSGVYEFAFFLIMGIGGQPSRILMEVDLLLHLAKLTSIKLWSIQTLKPLLSCF